MQTETIETQRSGVVTFALMILLVGSGCAALIYEVVWFHLLSLVIGATAVSLAMLLGSFMGGMCLGSIGFARVVSARQHPLRVLACLELGIAGFGLAMPWVLPLASSVYWSIAGYGFVGIMLRGTFAAVCLLPPTILMGATLPAVARWVEVSRVGYSRLGLFYGANIIGAVLGSLLAGFYLLRMHDVLIATYAAAAINALVAFTAIMIARSVAYRPPDSEPGPRTTSAPTVVHAVIALSGLTALGAEVVWTRLLSLLFGPTIYTFSIILAVFLLGLGLGSGLGSFLSRKLRRADFALAACQILLLLAIPFGAYMMTEVIPFWFPGRFAYQSIWERMTLDLIRGGAAMLPATLLWGASFPLALAAAGLRERDPGRLVGGIYAANTLGAIVGVLLFSLAAIPLLGTQRSEQLLTLLAGAAGALCFAAALLVRVPQDALDDSKGQPVSRPALLDAMLLALVIAVSTPLAWSAIPAVPSGLFAYGRNIEKWDISLEYPYIKEGIDSVVVVSRPTPDWLYFHVSGKVVASTDPADTRIEQMLAHLPALAHPNPRSALIVGCGTGITAGSLLLYPEIERIVICEIESRVLEAAALHFGEVNNGVLEDPRVEVIADDARHFLATTDEHFDIITTDPIHPWVRGAAALYTKEFFELCQERLNPGGVLVQWVPLYETSLEAVKSALATFIEVFPMATLWNSNVSGGGYDLVVMGTMQSTDLRHEDIARRAAENPAVIESLAAVGIPHVESLLRTYSGNGPELRDWLKDAQINTDRNLRLQYLAGLSLDRYEESEIYWLLMQGRL